MLAGASSDVLSVSASDALSATPSVVASDVFALVFAVLLPQPVNPIAHTAVAAKRDKLFTRLFFIFITP